MARPHAKVLRSDRFTSRRRDVRRARQLRRRRVTVGVLGVAVLATGGWMLARSSLFALERIDVVGIKVLSRTEVVAASGLRPGANMLSLDMAAVEARVAKLPLIRTVDVSKPEPSRIRIAVTERTPAFVLETIDGLWSLDAEAVVLGTVGADRTVPLIRSLATPEVRAGDHIDSPAVTDALQLWRLLPSSLRGGAPVIAVTAGVFTVTRAELTIHFGPIDRIEQKIEALKLVVERAHAARERLRSIDVRSPDRPAALAAA
ncbi:MAG: FtsQ-type POTRA domain-containing protein [Chloroflexi bacterium]|nr:FtsQ-type POTRA domain-containing protein [Chloroflexota bacterium]